MSEQAFPTISSISSYPSTDGDHAVFGSDGMTLRDYFAAKAMAAVLVCSQQSGSNAEPSAIAVASYILADAMIEAREQ